MYGRGTVAVPVRAGEPVRLRREAIPGDRGLIETAGHGEAMARLGYRFLAAGLPNCGASHDVWTGVAFSPVFVRVGNNSVRSADSASMGRLVPRSTPPGANRARFESRARVAAWLCGTIGGSENKPTGKMHLFREPKFLCIFDEAPLLPIMIFVCQVIFRASLMGCYSSPRRPSGRGAIRDQ